MAEEVWEWEILIRLIVGDSRLSLTRVMWPHHHISGETTRILHWRIEQEIRATLKSLTNLTLPHESVRTAFIQINESVLNISVQT